MVVVSLGAKVNPFMFMLSVMIASGMYTPIYTFIGATTKGIAAIDVCLAQCGSVEGWLVAQISEGPFSTLSKPIFAIKRSI